MDKQIWEISLPKTPNKKQSQEVHLEVSESQVHVFNRNLYCLSY